MVPSCRLSWHRVVVVAIAGLCVAACAGNTHRHGARGGKGVVLTQPVENTPTATKPPESAPSASTTNLQNPREVPPPPTTKVAPIGIVDTARLKSGDVMAMVDILGEPALRRKEPPAEIWQYHGEGCIADVFVYDEAGVQRVNLVQVRSTGGTRVSEAVCLDGIAKNHRPSP